MDIAIKNLEMPEAIVAIYIDLIIFNITNLLTHIDEFETDSIDLPLFEAFIVTVAPEALEVGNVITVNLTTNITTELFIQSEEVLPNQATAFCCQSTCVRQSIKYAAEAEALKQCK